MYLTYIRVLVYEYSIDYRAFIQSFACTAPYRYLDPYYQFPPQAQAIAQAVHLAENAHREDTGSLFLVATYQIGKERIATAIARAINSQIFVEPKKRQYSISRLFYYLF